MTILQRIFILKGEVEMMHKSPKFIILGKKEYEELSKNIEPFLTQIKTDESQFFTVKKYPVLCNLPIIQIDLDNHLSISVGS